MGVFQSPDDPAHSLDDFKFDLAPTSLVIDCEGYEVEVLKGRGLSSSLRSVFVETHVLSNGEATTEVCRRELESQFNFRVEERKDAGGLVWLLCWRRHSKAF